MDLYCETYAKISDDGLHSPLTIPQHEVFASGCELFDRRLRYPLSSLPDVGVPNIGSAIQQASNIVHSLTSGFANLHIGVIA